MADGNIRLTGNGITPKTYPADYLRFAISEAFTSGRDAMVTGCDDGKVYAYCKDGVAYTVGIESGGCGYLAVGSYCDGYNIDSTGMDWFDNVDDAIRHALTRVDCENFDDNTNFVDIVDVRSCVKLGTARDNGTYDGCKMFVPVWWA